MADQFTQALEALPPPLEHETLDLTEDNPKPVTRQFSADDLGVFLGESDIETLADTAVAANDAHLYMEAAVAFITDPNCSTVKALCNNPRFLGRVHPNTLGRWRKDGKWDFYRKKFFSAWLRETTRTVGSELVDAKREELRQLRKIRELALLKLDDENVMPRSWEGVAKAFVEISRRTDDVTEQLRDELATQASIKDEVERDAEEAEMSMLDSSPEAFKDMDEFISSALEKRRLAHAAQIAGGDTP